MEADKELTEALRAYNASDRKTGYARVVAARIGLRVQEESERLAGLRAEIFREDVARCRSRVRAQGGQKLNPNGTCPVCDGLVCGS